MGQGAKANRHIPLRTCFSRCAAARIRRFHGPWRLYRLAPTAAFFKTHRALPGGRQGRLRVGSRLCPGTDANTSSQNSWNNNHIRVPSFILSGAPFPLTVVSQPPGSPCRRTQTRHPGNLRSVAGRGRPQAKAMWLSFVPGYPRAMTNHADQLLNRCGSAVIQEKSGGANERTVIAQPLSGTPPLR